MTISLRGIVLADSSAHNYSTKVFHVVQGRLQMIPTDIIVCKQISVIFSYAGGRERGLTCSKCPDLLAPAVQEPA